MQLAKNPTDLAVVAGALSDDHSRWLLQKRPIHKHHGGLWEFPGGKIETGETPRAALVRELNEELTIAVHPESLVMLASASGLSDRGDQRIVITLYKVTAWEGFPVAEPGAELAWFTHEAIADLAMPPLDIALAKALPALA